MKIEIDPNGNIFKSPIKKLDNLKQINLHYLENNNEFLMKVLHPLTFVELSQSQTVFFQKLFTLSIKH